MKYLRRQYRDLLLERWGSTGATDAEIEAFLREIMGEQNSLSLEDFIDLCFGTWKRRKYLEDAKGETNETA